jgi:hypothetical protein
MEPSKLLKLVPVPSGDQSRFVEMDIVGDYTVHCVDSGSTVPTTFAAELKHLKFEGIHVG